MSNLKDLYPYIKPYALGCPEPAIDAEIVLITKELAKKTNAIRNTFFIDTQSGWGMYQLEVPDGQQLETVTQVIVGGMCIEALGQKPCDGCSAFGYWIDRNKVLHLYPSPAIDEVQGLEVEYSYSPTITSCDIDSDFVERYGSDIANGVLGRLLRMKDQKWYDMTLARDYTNMWERAKISALTDGSTPYSKSFISISVDGSNYLDT